MASALLAGGVEIELATTGEVKAIVDSGADRVLDGIGRNNPNRGIPRTLAASVSQVAAATGTFVLDFGMPQGNTIWWVGDIAVICEDVWTATAEAKAAVFIGTPPGHANGVLSTGQSVAKDQTMVRPGTAIPATFQFSERFIPVHQGESLYVVVKSTTTAVTLISASARVIQVDANAVASNTIR